MGRIMRERLRRYDRPSRIAETAGMSATFEPDPRFPFTVRSVAELSPEQVVHAFGVGFAGYPIPMTMTAAQLDARFRAESGDPFASRVFFSGDEPVGILLINRRGWVARVGAMALATEMRGTGFGVDVIRRALFEARSRGDARLVLEVIHDNTRAVKLYERAGFAVVRSLWGFTLDAVTGDIGVAPALEIDPAAGALRAGSFGEVDLPWQLQVASLAAMVRPTRCFVDPEGAIVAMVDATQDTIRLRALALAADASTAQAAAFTASLRAVFPGRAWSAPPLFSGTHRTNFFVPGAWTAMDLRQFEMVRPLDAIA